MDESIYLNVKYFMVREQSMNKMTLLQRFKMLTTWNKIGVVGSVVTIASALISVLLYIGGTEKDVTVSNERTIISDSAINSQGVINNSIIVFPVTKESVSVKKEEYSPETIIKSVYLDSVDHTRSSNNRVMARSVHGLYYDATLENNILFSGITPFKLENVGAIFGPDYRLLGIVSKLDETKKTVRIDITAISMVDDYGNAFEIRSKNSGYIGYAESLDKISQQVVNMKKTEKGFFFEYGNDVQIILAYNKDDVELVGKTR